MRDTTTGAAATSGKLETIWITILYVFMGPAPCGIISVGLVR
jgi:hypothetical protein